MKKQLIFSDIDGTLLDKNHHVSSHTIKLIKTLLDQGHLFYVATGRMYQSAISVAQSIDSRVQTIASNGGIFEVDGQCHSSQLEAEDAEKVYDVAQKYGIPLFFFSAQTVYYSDTLPHYFTDKKDTDRLGDETQHPFIAIRTKADFKQHVAHFISGIMISEEPKMLAEAKKSLQTSDSLGISSSYSNNIEITRASTSKKTAITFIQAAYGISKAQTICFGDGENDLEMFQAAETSVAMGNAEPTIKSQANFETSSNLDNGVYHFLTTYFQKEGLSND